MVLVSEAVAAVAVAVGKVVSSSSRACRQLCRC